MEIKHNCTKEGNFEFTEVDPFGKLPDKMKCLECGRIWVEE